MNSKDVLKYLIVFSLFFISIGFVHAQGVSTTIQGIEMKVSNVSPAPGQTLTVTAESFVADLNGSNITWKLNGTVFQKGVGVTSIDVQAPPLGKKLTITVTAVSAEGRTMTDTKTLSSGNVDLILETDGYVPPFFLGKIPLTYQNYYRIIAMPHLADSTGKEYDPKTLVYEWSKDSRVVQDQGGYGKQVFSWKDEIVPRQRAVSVKVFTKDGSAQASKTIFIEATKPSVSLYRDDPLYGTLFNSSVGDSVRLGKSGEASILAVPFGFNIPASGVGDLSYTWLLNSVKQDALSANQAITLRAPANTTGSSNIKVTVINTQELLEKAERAISVHFIKSGDTSIINNASTLNSNGI